jgi:octaprenyl-diphosphate synthase
MNRKKTALLPDSVFPLDDDLRRFEEDLAAQFDFPEAPLRAHLSHVRSQKGKRIRPVVCLLAQGMVSPGAGRNVRVAVLVELLHTASLLHDDVVDGAVMRRGTRNLNALAGNTVSVLAGDLLMAHALQLALDEPVPNLVPALSRALFNMTAAELRQAGLDRTKPLSESAYLDILKGKTAGLFEAATELAGRSQGAQEPQVETLVRFGRMFGTAFQIRDDIQDFAGQAGAAGKPVGQDLSTGLWTLPLICAYNDASEAERILALAGIASLTTESQKWLRAFVESHDGTGKAARRADGLLSQAADQLAGFPESAFKTALRNLCAPSAESRR